LGLPTWNEIRGDVEVVMTRGLSFLLEDDVRTVPLGLREEHHGLDLGPCVVIKGEGTGPSFYKSIVDLTVVHEDPVAGEEEDLVSRVHYYKT
jgi:hypothetical protein